MHGEVLGARQELAIFFAQTLPIISISLQSSHHGQSHLRGEERILAVGLLPASPAGVTEDVDVWRPEGEALVTLDITTALGLLSLHTGLVADSGEYLMQQGVVP